MIVTITKENIKKFLPATLEELKLHFNICFKFEKEDQDRLHRMMKLLNNLENKKIVLYDKGLYKLDNQIVEKSEVVDGKATDLFSIMKSNEK